MKENTIYESLYAIGDTVVFIPMYRHQKQYGIQEFPIEGVITAVRFTKAKVFYDIVDDYCGKLFDNVDSIKVGETEESIEYLKVAE